MEKISSTPRGVPRGFFYKVYERDDLENYRSVSCQTWPEGSMYSAIAPFSKKFQISPKTGDWEGVRKISNLEFFIFGNFLILAMDFF